MALFYIEEAFYDFSSFIMFKARQRRTYLSQYADDWILEGDGLRFIRGSFANYLRLLIFADQKFRETLRGIVDSIPDNEDVIRFGEWMSSLRGVVDVAQPNHWLRDDAEWNYLIEAARRNKRRRRQN